MREIDIYTWSDIDAICKKLAATIEGHFDIVVCILRGGAIPGVIIANELNIQEVLAIKVIQKGQVSGAGQGNGAYEPDKGVILVPLNDTDLEGRRVLVVDDVLDSGESAKLVLEEVGKRKPAIVKLAVMQKKSYSKIEPDFYVEVKSNWLFYPWMSSRELEEMKERLSGNARLA